jgi:quinol monooxygenase YgiN
VRWKAPEADSPPPQGQVVLAIEYRIDPARAEDFLRLMQESRRSRLRQGALRWELLHDLGDPGRFVEQIVDESWTEHLRRFDRISSADVALRERRLAFHVGAEPPVIRRYVLEQTLRE